MDQPYCVVVLGANSFSGQDLVDLLLADRNTKVLGISRSNERSSLFLRYLGREREDLDRYRYHALDLNTDLDTVKALVDDFRPSCVVNFAAQSEMEPSWAFPQQYFQTNVVALSQLMNHFMQQDYLERFVQISSTDVYGSPKEAVDENGVLEPDSPYAASKASADLLLQTYHTQVEFPVVTVRSTEVYGAGQLLYKTIPLVVGALKRRQMISTEGATRVSRSLLHVRDVSRGILAAMQRGRLGETYHLSPERAISLRDLVGRICDLMEVRMGDVADDPDEADVDTSCYIDSSRARTELGWAPTVNIDEGLGEVVEWFDENWSVIERLPVEYVHHP